MLFIRKQINVVENNMQNKSSYTSIFTFTDAF